MATTFAQGNSLTTKKIARKVMKESLQQLFFARFMGTGDNNLIYIHRDLEKQNGSDQIIVPLRVLLAGEGQGDDGIIKGNEESLVYRNMPIYIHERGHAVDLGGKMTNKRSSLNLRSEGSDAMRDWFTEIHETDLVQTLCGLPNVSTAIQTINESDPSSNRILYIGETADGVLYTSATLSSDAALSAVTATDVLFGPRTVELVARRARHFKIRPIRDPASGKTVYVMFITPLQQKAWRASTVWNQAMREAENRGKDNPIFTNSDGVWNDVVIHTWDRMPERTGAGGTTPAEGFLLNAGRTATTDAVASGATVGRAVLCGAQAISLALGANPNYFEYFNDAGQRHPAVGMDAIYGMKKSQYKTEAGDALEDFGTITVDTNVVAD